LEERRNRQDLIEVFADFSGKVNNRASGLVYIGKEQQGYKRPFTQAN